MALPLRVTVSPDRLDAACADSPTLDISVRNTSDIVEHYVIDVQGLPEGASVRSEPEVTKLRPGDTGSATLHLTIPAEPPAAAGRYVLGVVVHSRYHEEVSRCEELPLTIASVEKITVRVEPEVGTGGRFAQYGVEVTNDGNTPAAVRLTATDPERRVRSAFQPATLELRPGASARTALTVRAPIPWSKEKQRRLRIEAAGHSVGGEVSATFVQRPHFASRLTRMAGALAAVAVLAAAIVAAAVAVKSKGNNATQSGTHSPAAAPASGGTGASATTAPSTAPTTRPSEPAAPAMVGPQVVDLTAPVGVSASETIPSDAFSGRGITLSGVAAHTGSCVDATAVVVRGDSATGRFLAAARPGDPAACNQLWVQIRFREPAVSVEVVPGGPGTPRMTVFFKDNWSIVDNGLKAVDDQGRGGIDYVEIGPPVTAPGAAPVVGGAQTVRFTPLAASARP
jgi:hypothetical protein